MKIEIEITEQEIKDLKLIRYYFGENDKKPINHLAYNVIDRLVKKLQQPPVIKSVCEYRFHNAEIAERGRCFYCDETEKQTVL